jgi:rhodanese-related sulfurtransferase
MKQAVSVQELCELRRGQAPHRILDVRERPELEICQLDGALHIAMGDVPARLNELPKDQPLIVMCHHGVRSRIIVGFLRDTGFNNAVNLDGGIDAWAREIDASVARY